MLLGQRYQPLAQPRAGSVAQLWTARDRVLGSVCVLKLAPAGGTAAERVLRESSLLADIEHPRLPRCLDRFDAVPGFERGPVSGFAMPWIDGQLLDEITNALPWPDRVARFGGVLDAVGYLHHRGILHLDLKPANVLVTSTGPVLLDLGTAQRADSGPLQVGGTIGYAAPEVLEHAGPTVAADVYSLGILLYELLSGRRPFPAVAPHELRRDILGGNPVPLRAVAPFVPLPLSELVHAMIERSPDRRPAGVHEVRSRLEELGHPVPPPTPGAPPLLGRATELEDLQQMLEADASPIALIGARGSGRDRLTRAAFGHFLSTRTTGRIDLSGAAHVLTALYALLTLADGEVTDPGGAIEAAIRRRLARAPTFRGRVYVGRLEDLAPEVRGALLDLQPHLTRAGVGLVWAAERCPPGARPFPVAPLEPADLERVGRFAGANPGPTLRQWIVACDGNPGRLLRAVRDERQELPPELAAALDALRTLPIAIPQPVVARLGGRWRSDVDALVVLGLAHWRADQRLVVEGARARVFVAPELAARLDDLPDDLPADWLALTLCRLGRVHDALSHLRAILAHRDATSERAELLEHLARAGSAEAARELSWIRVSELDFDAALAALDLAPPDAHDFEARLQTLVVAERYDRAEALIAANPPPWSAAIWLQAAQMAIARGAFDRAAHAIDEAERLEPENLSVVGRRLALAARQLVSGARVPALAELLDRAVAAAEANQLDYASLSQCGRALLRSGDVERACRVLELSVRAADAAASVREATIVRVNYANALMGAGRGEEARRYYAEALAGARALRFEIARIRILYSLGELELRANRLGPATRWIREFDELARQMDDPEVDAHGRTLHAWLAAAEGRFADIPAIVEPVLEFPNHEVQQNARTSLASALVDLGRPDEALGLLDGPPPARAFGLRNHMTARGRAHLALARRDLAVARELVPDDPEPHDAGFIGRALLASAGEDLDPETFEQRRVDLDRAARMLRGAEASRAATLRDRLLSAPGAGLAGIVDLLEAVRDPKRFPRTLARIVSEALGANRVLILMRIPGLGRQLGFMELTQQEVAGISQEVMRRIVRADDVWLAADAFADPAIREVSATVRTFEIRSVLAVAIPSGEHAVGALYVDDLHRSNRFSDDDVAILRRLAAAASHLISMIVPGNVGSTALDEPEDLLGVLLADARHVTDVRQTLEMLADARNEHANLLITGATGTGKTWLADRIAKEVLGLRGVIAHNIRQTDPDKLVGTLAGTRRGEFTGAVEQRGLVRAAIEERKALFLDEVQALDDGGQTALLPLLELPKRRLGGITGETIHLDPPVVVMLGTNVDVSSGRWRQHFRQDLWFRMSQLHIHLPTLAERGPEVVYRYLANLLEQEGVRRPPEEVLDSPALQYAVRWSWPGNLRELVSAAKEIAFRYRRAGKPLGRSELETIRVFQQDEEVDLTSTPEPPRVVEPQDPTVAEMWRLLGRLSWNQSEVARLLGCSTSTVNRALKRAGLLEEVRIRRARHTGG